MKDKNFLAILVILALSGGFYYKNFYLKDKTVSKIIIPKVTEKPLELNEAPAPVDKSEMVNKDRVGDFIVSSILQEDLPRPSESDQRKTIDLFSTLGIKLKIQKAPPATEFSKWEGDIGAADFFSFRELLRTGKKLVPVFGTYGKNENTKCSYALDVITKIDSKILQFKDLDKKQIAVNQDIDRNGPIIRKLFVDANIKAQRVYAEINLAWVEKALSENSIEAVVNVRRDYTYGASNSSESPEFGKYNDGKFVNFPQYKIAVSQKIKFPCDLLFLDQKLSEDDQLKLINAFRKVNQASIKEGGLDYLNAIGNLSSLEELPLADRANIVDTLNAYEKKDSSKDFTEEFFKMKLGKN